jgi:hypothetical protein
MTMQGLSLDRTPLLATLAAALLLAACGGGGDEPAGTGAGSAAVAGEPEAGGRAQRLAATMPPLDPAPAGLRGNIRCSNWRVGAVTVDNVEVPAGMACRLTGTTVRGSVQAEPGGVLIAGDVAVAGSVQGSQAAHLQISGAATRIAGSVQAEGGGSLAVEDARVSGDVFANGLLDLVEVRGTQVGGNVQITDNLGGGAIVGNRISGNLQCTGNLPAPLASDNVAAQIENQCRPGGDSGGGGSSTPPLSGNVTCVGLTIGAIRLDSVIVPAGARCTLLGTQLLGSLEVGASAHLIADGVAITGNIVSDGAAELTVGGASSVGGSVQVQRGAAATLAGLAINGNLQIYAMTGPVSANDNRVGGNLQAMASRGGLLFVANRINGVMQCKDNLPPPAGSGNVATLKEDQCRGL